MIERELFDELRKLDLRTEYISQANFFFGDRLSAALELGDPAYLEADLDWVKRLLSRRHILVERLRPYLAAYRHAISKEMGAPSAPITDWIDNYMAQDETAR